MKEFKHHSKATLTAAVFAFLAACNSSSGVDQGTDVGNAFDTTDSLILEAEDGLVGVIAENDIGTSTSLTTRRPRLFPRSPLRGDCPVSERESAGLGVTITRTFESCRPIGSRGGIFDGTTVISITREGDDDPDNEVFNRSGTIERSIEVTYASGRTRTIVDNHEFTTTGTYPNIVHEVVINSSRSLKNSSGSALTSPSNEGTVSYTFSGDTEMDQILMDGELTTTEPRRGATITSTFTNLKWTEDCCHPISGSITQSIELTRRASQTREISYGPACGNIEISGKAYTLSDCE